MVLIASAILMVIMGTRQSQGLFISPLNTSTGIGIVGISLAMAIGHFIWGAVQPVAGAIADRYGPGRVLAAGVLAFALGTALTPLAQTPSGLILTLGVLAAIGAGAASFSVLIGAVGRYVPAEKRGFAFGVINAGSSFGQFLFAPLSQFLISATGWMTALWTLSVVTLALLPLTRMLRARKSPASADLAAAESGINQVAPTDRSLRSTLAEALTNPSYLFLHAGFFTCGFHITFLVTHLPGEVELCGQPPQVASWSLSIIGAANVAGSLIAGWGTQKYRSKYLLFWMYASRAALILAYLAAPKTALTFFIFAGGLGFTWLATVPPTAAIVGKLFGGRHLGTLFGLTLLSHQVGGFLGAWLGGITIVELGNYTSMWYLDAGLAVLAALFNLPIREARIKTGLNPV
ncbi:MAG TPA: MFS transporter [Burkholderiales bacterium]|nr:MFS transporter [Burkholderiales bacterium]